MNDGQMKVDPLNILGDVIGWSKEPVADTNMTRITIGFVNGVATKMTYEFSWMIKMNDGYSLDRHLDRLYASLDIQRVATETVE